MREREKELKWEKDRELDGGEKNERERDGDRKWEWKTERDRGVRTA